MSKDNSKKNKQMAINLAMVAAGMMMLAYAAVPLYNMFCRVTGFGGTTQMSQVLPTDIRDRMVTVRFDSNVDANLNWSFKPDQQAVKVKVGENGIASFTVKNNSNKPVVGMATYNVTPLKTGKYFNKVYCFCFDEQTIKAGEEVQFPVSFFIEPKFADDKYMDDIDTITLSYTFYEAQD